MTASNMVEIPKVLFESMVYFIRKSGTINETERWLLIDEIEQWMPFATDEELERSFDAYR